MDRARKAGLRMTLDEFLLWDSGDDRRYELIAGEVVMMAPATEPHGTLVMNLGASLRPTLSKRPPCRVVAEGAITRPGARDRCYHADVVVTCTPPARGRILIEQPLLIAEVLSPSTESTDRRIKVPDYRSISSLREILLIDQGRAFVELLRRLDGDRWLTILAIGIDAKVMLESLDLELRLADLYRDVEIETDEDAESD
ncbi:Uma2 family endonuclease [Azospirillum sp. RWY-5-1]|uniref:Uma2 family endonuclease n=1 Tax=Azospirillum oleiclasticum TaxID=2735135 RepID=A0ABX2TGX7_9PROT|nr:Uma2 family endonuclease [Azospirillum oleiclasticum]NYZ14645.1 Uma2 family endonuclease [Azospirillum oleiclasticum]NYZ22368.1 Uma2 family endonuclease [Azospirillum oleiclasticum]